MGGELAIAAAWVLNAAILFVIAWRMVQTRRKIAFAATAFVALAMYLPWVIADNKIALSIWIAGPVVACVIAVPVLFFQERTALAVLFALPLTGALFGYVFSPRMVSETPFYMKAPMIFPTLAFLVAPTIIAVTTIFILRSTIEPVRDR